MSATLEIQLQQASQRVESVPESIREPLLKAKSDIIEQFNAQDAIQVGSKFPGFKLNDALGNEVNSEDLLANGLLLITFYRGAWCPFCNLALRAFQKRLDDIKAKGVTFVAISPELPDNSLDNVQKSELAFPVLSDAGLQLARKLGIVWHQPDILRPVYAGFGTDLTKQNGDESFELPIPTTLLVDQKGVVRNVYANADYFKRLEPQEALNWIDALQQQ